LDDVVHMRIPIIVVGLLIGAGCRTEPVSDPQPASTALESPSPVEPEPEPEPEIEEAGAAKSACTVEFGPDSQSILVAGQPSPIVFESGDTRLVAHPVGEGEFLVAVGYEYPWYPQRTSTAESLWRVRCAEPSKAERVLERPGADLAASALSRDGKHIYFSNGGVDRYTIATGKVEPMIPSRSLSDCWMDESSGGVGSDEFVQGWAGPNELLVLSGGPCGFEAEWVGELQILTDLDTTPKRRPRAWVGALATGASSRLWVGDGNQCSLEFDRSKAGTPGVWRSDDVGANWTFLPLKGSKAGVEQLWPSASDPDRVVALTECCVPYGADCSELVGGGSLFLTTNGGKTWKKIMAYSDDLGIKGLLVDEATHEMTVFGYASALVTRDDGRSWDPSDATLATPPDPRARIQVGNFVLEPTEDGLERRDLNAAPGTGEIVLRPGPNARK
jgi:hypothetical protein